MSLIVVAHKVSASETDSQGWMLLSTVNLLAAGGEKLVEVMTSASVPSTLVKCLYLFFDLSATEGDTEEEAEAPTVESEAEFTPRERRILLQKMFMQVIKDLNLIAPKLPLSHFLPSFLSRAF